MYLRPEGKYEVQIETSAAKQIQKLQRTEQLRVMDAVCALSDEPRPNGCTKLTSTGDAYRVRVGVFRIVCVVDDGVLIVTVTRVGHRREVYNR